MSLFLGLRLEAQVDFAFERREVNGAAGVYWEGALADLRSSETPTVGQAEPEEGLPGSIAGGEVKLGGEFALRELGLRRGLRRGRRRWGRARH